MKENIPDDIEDNEMNEDDDADNQANDVELGRRRVRPPERYGEWVHIADAPSTVCEALSSPEKSKWEQAIKKELQSLQDNDVYDLVELPPGRRAVGSKWVFKEKLGADGVVSIYKARLVAQGYAQREGLDYDETFSPVVRPESVRTLFALAAKKKLILHQMDVTTAFLNGTLKEEVFMKQPEGSVEKGKEHLVCKLKKSLYGLKQSSRCWNQALHKHLCNVGFIQNSSDPCIYTSKDGKNILAIYVDDIILAAQSQDDMDYMKRDISSKFDLKDLGELRYFLGVSVQRDSNGSVSLDQSGYSDRILNKFDMNEAKPVSTPVDISMKLVKNDESESVDKELYQSAVGSLLYLSQWTRPDLSYAVGNVAKFCENPSKNHWVAVKRIMRYLKGTVNHGLRYFVESDHSDNNTILIGYSDADWAGDIDSRRSTSGYVFQMSGCAVSWKSKRQNCVALSTAEAEYVALSSAVQEAMWLQHLVAELNNQPVDTVTIMEDNKSAICMAKETKCHGRAKHISIKYHFVREQVESKNVMLKYCPTENMVADVLTKGLSKPKHEVLTSKLGVVKVK